MTLKTTIKDSFFVCFRTRKQEGLDMNTKRLLVLFAIFSMTQASWFDVMDSLVPIPVPRCTDVGISLTPDEWAT